MDDIGGDVDGRDDRDDYIKVGRDYRCGNLIIGGKCGNKFVLAACQRVVLESLSRMKDLGGRLYIRLR